VIDNLLLLRSSTRICGWCGSLFDGWSCGLSYGMTGRETRALMGGSCPRLSSVVVIDEREDPLRRSGVAS